MARRLPPNGPGCTPSPRPDDAIHRYGATIEPARDAVAERIRRGAEVSGEHDPESGAAEALEFLRAMLHIEIDRQIDEEALRWPSARRLIYRPGRYRRHA
ncbi:hypothetical protein [Actinomadura litoris]|uniref:Uncharacterized protein n=1 Tax=Actinomadura litoris TaxID=2678616 RepID=A0A7K1L3H6_9ACTN|nr:hypothetical protein [Actinomadura litoris]MUN38984.1 hypothetical protein [Actinomadura litoris]